MNHVDLIIQQIRECVSQLAEKKYTGQIRFDINMNKGGIGQSMMSLYTRLGTIIQPEGEQKPQG